MGLLHRLISDRKGNIAIATAATCLPLVMAVGLGVDIAGTVNKQQELQNALDSAALAIAREGPELSDAAARSIANGFLRSNFGSAVDKLAVNRGGHTVTVAATVDAQMAFSGVFGLTDWTITADAVAEVAPARYEMAFVLDTTGSMAGAKLAAMKDAVNHVIDELTTRVGADGTVRIAIVPYSGFVNVGPEHGPEFGLFGTVKKPAAPWLDEELAAPVPQSDLPDDMSRFALYHHLGQTWPGCVETRMPGKGNHDVNDTEPSKADPGSLFMPAFNIDEPDDSSRYPNSYLADAGFPVGAGLLEERLRRYGAPAKFQKPKNIIEWIIQILSWRKVPTDFSPSTFYADESDPKGPGFGCEVEPLLPLTSDMKAVRNKINALNANGTTNITEGVMWGWRVLSDREPFSEGSAKGAGARKIMVVLTDGSNQFGLLENDLGSGYTSMGYLADERLHGLGIGATGGDVNKAMNAKTLAACTNAKADGMEIFTIRLEEPNVATGQLLEQCASSPAHYFDSPTRDRLKPIFEHIKHKLVTVRLVS